MIVREALAQGSADLKFAGIESPSLDASLLLAHVLKTSRTALFAAGTKPLSEKACAEFCALVERRCSGECTAYLIRKKEFRGLEFTVNKSVLVPRPDTETLVEAALEILNNKPQANTNQHESSCNAMIKNLNVLDLCTGSGAVAVSLKHEKPELEVYATDISADALEVAKQNAFKLLGKNRIHFYSGDLFGALSSLCISAPLCEFFLIVSNPPYVSSCEIDTLSAEVRNEPRIALDGGDCGLDIIKRIINEAPDYLQCGGILLLEADPRQMDDITVLLEKRGFNNIQLYKDLSGSQRVIGGRYEK
jgi:release factor glutamine methyltransferase